MAETTDNTVTGLPAKVTIDPQNPPAHTPREIGLVSGFLGKEWGAMTAAEADQAGVWLTLRRLGYDPTWDQALDVLVDYRTADPTNGGPPTSSPDSAGSGE